MAESLRLLKAEAAAGLGRLDEAGVLIREAGAVDDDPSLELRAEFERVAGIACIHAGEPLRAGEHLNRAARHFNTAGHLTARRLVLEQRDRTLELAARKDAAGTGPAGTDGRSTDRLANEPFSPGGEPGRQNNSADARGSMILERAVAAVNLGGFPELMGHELASLLVDAGVATEVVVVTTDGERRVAAGSAGCSTDRAAALAAERKPACRVALGCWRDKPVELVLSAPGNFPSAVSLAAVERLARTALWCHEARRSERERTALWPIDAIEEPDREVFVSQLMLDLVHTARRIAPTALPVLITGETGTGKEVLARLIHRASTRADRPFVPFNCTAVARDMVDSQLFGHRRGAFTGATADFQGVIRGTGGGTLFLDEIGEVALDVQPKLLRFIESGEVHPLGEPRPTRADVRIIAATNANLDHLVRDGRFREDLYYRLNVVHLGLPPLRERREEIPPLVEHYLRRASEELNRRDLRIADETMEHLLLYRWPGNVRELANEVRRVVAFAENGAVLMPEHLKDEITAGRRTIPVGLRPPAPNEVIVRVDQPLAAAFEHVERTAIRYWMEKTQGRVEEVAKRLGLSRKGLYLKRQRLGMLEP